MLIVVARYVGAEGHDSTVARLLRKNAEASRAEPGCLEFSVHQCRAGQPPSWSAYRSRMRRIASLASSVMS